MTKDINVGDYVEIKNAKGVTRSGKVISANYWAGDGWQIEFTGGPGGYGHWKQWEDGGKILEHKPEENLEKMQKEGLK